MGKCNGCEKEILKGKYCSKKCGVAARVRKHRGAPKEAVILVRKAEEIAVYEGPIKKARLDPRLRNTIHDPNPDWNPNKAITDNNRTMTCPMCGKLSLTHFKMCSPVNGGVFQGAVS